MATATASPPLLNTFTYLTDPGLYFTVDGYAVRHHALMLPERMEAAREIYDGASRIAEEASARLMKYLKARNREPAVNLQQDPCRRDLELIGQTIAAVAVGENYQGFEAHTLRHMVIEVAKGYDVPDGTAMLMMYAIQVSREVLTGVAQRLFEGYCWQAMEYLRHGAAGAYMAVHAHELATFTYDRMAESVSRLEDAYGSVTRQRGIRDMSMLLAGSQESLASMTKTPASARTAAKVNMLGWIFEYVAVDVPKYTETVWMPLFRHFWEMAVTRLPTPYAAVAADVFRSLGQAGRRFREGAKLYERARELARNAAYSYMGADGSSTKDVAQAGQITVVFESILKKIALNYTVGVSPVASGLAREWLQFHCNRMPVPDPVTAAQMAETLHVSTRNAMRVSWNRQLDALFESITSASQNFAAIVRVNRLIPEMVSLVMKAVMAKVRLPDAAATERRLIVFTSKCFELAARGPLADNSEIMWTWFHYCLDGAWADPPEMQAAMYRMLPEFFMRLGGAAEAPQLHQFLQEVAAAAVHLPAARLIRGSRSEAYAEAALQAAQISDRRIPTTELVFLLDRVAHAMLRGGSAGAIAQLTDWFGTHCTPHHLPLTPIEFQQRVMQALGNAIQPELPEVSRELFSKVMGGLEAQLPLLMSSAPIQQEAETIATQAMRNFAATPQWNEFGLQGKEAKSARDLHLLLLAIAYATRTANEFTVEQLTDWTRDNLVGFLKTETYKSIVPMLQHVEQVAASRLKPDVVAVLMTVLRRAYGIKTA